MYQLEYSKMAAGLVGLPAKINQYFLIFPVGSFFLITKQNKINPPNCYVFATFNHNFLLMPVGSAVYNQNKFTK